MITNNNIKYICKSNKKWKNFFHIFYYNLFIECFYFYNIKIMSYIYKLYKCN